MGTKIKGVFKSFKYISQIFVVKEREMDIGYPTDVKHVAHIGWDGQQTSAPSWMNEFKSDFSLSNLSETKESNRVQLSSWSSQDFEQSSMQTASDIFKDEYFCTPPTDLPKAPKKHKRKKTRSSTSSPRSSSTSRSSRGAAAAAATTSRASAFSTEVYMTPNSQGVVAIP